MWCGAEYAMHLLEQLHWTERLAKASLRLQIAAGHLHLSLGEAGHQDHRNRSGAAITAETAKHLATGKSGHAAIAQDQVGEFVLGAVQGSVAIGGFEHAAIAVLEHGPDKVANTFLVIYYQNGAHGDLHSGP